MEGDTIFCEHGNRIVDSHVTYDENRGGEVIKGVAVVAWGEKPVKGSLVACLATLVLPLVTPIDLEESRRMGR